MSDLKNQNKKLKLSETHTATKLQRLDLIEKTKQIESLEMQIEILHDTIKDLLNVNKQN